MFSLLFELTLLLFIVAVVLVCVPFTLLLACVLLKRENPNLSRVQKGIESPHPDSARPSFQFVIPAHNEEGSIPRTIASVKALNYPHAHIRILVIADNCTDQTASVARAAGAEVYERTDHVRKSKGFALEDVLGALTSSQHEYQHQNQNQGEQKEEKSRGHICSAFVIIDADTSVSPDLLHTFEPLIAAGTDFAQAYYSVRNSDQSWRTRLLTYALALFNGVYLDGLDRMKLGAHLRGNGMMFTRQGLERVPWKAASLAEDLEFAWILRLAGEDVRFVKQGVVYADMPASAAASRSQRARWEHGRSTLRSLYTPAILKAQVPLWKRCAWLMDLWMPPLSLLIAAVFLGCGGALGVLFLLPGMAPAELLWPILGLALMNFAIILCYLVSPFVTMKLPLRYALTLAVAPYYALWRLFVVAGRKPTAWIRTVREDSEVQP